MTTPVSVARRSRYEREGCLFPLPVLTAGEVERFRGALESLEARLGGQPRPIGLAHLFFRWAYDLALHPQVLDEVEAVLGPELLVSATLVLCKYPRDPSFVAWHQDGTYSGLHKTPTTSAWIALSPSTADNGCMRFIPGSHRGGLIPHAYTYAPGNLLAHGEEIRMAVDEAQAVAITLEAGEMSLHQNDLVHGSQASRSDVKRIGFIVRFVTPLLAHSDLPLVRARGAADCSHLTLLEAPPEEGAGAVDAWREFTRRRAERQRRSQG